MDKDQMARRLAKEFLNIDGLGDPDVYRDGRVECDRDMLKRMLIAAFEEGARAAPAKRLQATIVASRFNTTITLYDALQGRVSVTLRDDNGEGAHYGIDVKDITDVELLAFLFKDEKVGVFQEVVKLLSAYHNGTIAWDKG